MKVSPNALLRQYGLSQNEARVYIFLLKKIEGSAYEIAEALGIPKTTVYDTLEGLKKSGLVSNFQKNGTRFYTPENLNRLEEILNQKQTALQEVAPILRNYVEEARLKGPSVKFYIGKKNAKIIWEDMIETYTRKKPRVAYGISHFGELEKMFPRYIYNWIERRRKFPMITKLIFPESDRKNVEGFVDPKTEEVRYIPDNFLYPGEVTTYGDKVGIMTFDKKEPQTIIVESKELREMFERNFEFMWEMAKK